MTKKELRKIYKAKRTELAPKQILVNDDLLLIHFQRLGIGMQVQVVMSYFPIVDRVEIDPHLFVEYLRMSLPHLQVAYPVINAEDYTMQPYLVAEEEGLVINSYGIEEPSNGALVATTDIDLVFVPLLAFDTRGYRVGYGKGFYDRFLKQCRPDVLAIGFSYFDPVDIIEDTNQFDIPLNYCITPRHVYEF